MGKYPNIEILDSKSAEYTILCEFAEFLRLNGFDIVREISTEDEYSVEFPVCTFLIQQHLGVDAYELEKERRKLLNDVAGGDILK